MGEAYTATADAVPVGPQYVAMGHIHAPQPVPGARVPAQYAGSLLELDFGEAGEEKRVVIVDVEPGLPAKTRSVPLHGGRRLLRPSGPWDELLAVDGIYESYLDLVVETAGPDPGLADRARAEFDFLVRVRAEYPRAEPAAAARADRTLTELYADFYQEREGAVAPPALVAAYDEVLEEVSGASA
jgi:exonuclease SbcD